MITTKKRAWVIRWEDVTTSPIQRKVIAIMDSRISGERIRWFVEQFYMTQTSTPTERGLSRCPREPHMMYSGVAASHRRRARGGAQWQGHDL